MRGDRGWFPSPLPGFLPQHLTGQAQTLRLIDNPSDDDDDGDIDGDDDDGDFDVDHHITIIIIIVIIIITLLTM